MKLLESIYDAVQPMPASNLNKMHL